MNEKGVKPMRKISLDEVKELATISREALWSDAEAAGLDTPKIILHWTAGWWEQLFLGTDDEPEGYHINITGDGDIYTNVDSLAEYRAHTWKRNSGTVGIALCCAAEATTSALGNNPPTEQQIEIAAQIVAIICDAIKIEITASNVLTHGEAGDSLELYSENDLYGPQNGCERWDLQFLGTEESPEYTADHADISTGGNVIRGKAVWYLEHLAA